MRALCRRLLLGNALCGSLAPAFVRQQDGQGQRVVVEQSQTTADGSVQLPACAGTSFCLTVLLACLGVSHGWLISAATAWQLCILAVLAVLARSLTFAATRGSADIKAHGHCTCMQVSRTASWQVQRLLGGSG